MNKRRSKDAKQIRAYEYIRYFLLPKPYGKMKKIKSFDIDKDLKVYDLDITDVILVASYYSNIRLIKRIFIIYPKIDLTHKFIELLSYIYRSNYINIRERVLGLLLPHFSVECVQYIKNNSVIQRLLTPDMLKSFIVYGSINTEFVKTANFTDLLECLYSEKIYQMLIHYGYDKNPHYICNESCKPMNLFLGIIELIYNNTHY